MVSLAIVAPITASDALANHSVQPLALKGPKGRGAPITVLAENAKQSAGVVCDCILQGTGPFGYNVPADRVEDLVHAGVIDPTAVVRAALFNAASVAGLWLTSDVLIAEKLRGNG